MNLEGTGYHVMLYIVHRVSAKVVLETTVCERKFSGWSVQCLRFGTEVTHTDGGMESQVN